MSQTPDMTGYPNASSPSEVTNKPLPRIDQNIESRTGAAFEVYEGEQILIRDWSGKQCCVLVAFKRGDTAEYLSTANTREAMGSIMLRKGMTLVSNRRNWLLRLEEDTVGRHDLLVPACDARRYLEYYGLPGHANCRDNLKTALAPHGITEDQLPDPVNIFMHVAILSKGELEVRNPLSEPGDEVVFQALADLIVAVSACPQDQNATNGFNPTDLLVRVFPAPPAARQEPAAVAATTEEVPAGEPAVEPKPRRPKSTRQRKQSRDVSSRTMDIDDSNTTAASVEEPPAALPVAEPKPRRRKTKGTPAEEPVTPQPVAEPKPRRRTTKATPAPEQPNAEPGVSGEEPDKR